MKHSNYQQQIRVFAALARHLNMRRAAAELDLTPSAVSHGLTALEQGWGCRLFERNSRRMTLSSIGRDLLPVALGVLGQMRDLEDRIRTRRDQPEGRLRIGASAVLGQQVLPAALREFRETCPEMTVRIEVCNTLEAEEFLGNNQLDLAFVAKPSTTSRFTFEILAEDELQFVVHPLHPWAVERRARPSEMTRRNLILPERRDETHTLIRNYFCAEKIAVDPFVETAAEDSIRHYVQLNLGVGILPRWMVADEVARGVLTVLPLGRRRLKRVWGVLHGRGGILSFPEHLFSNICGTVLRQRILMDS